MMTSYTLWLSKKFITLNDAALLLVKIFPSDLERPAFRASIANQLGDILAARTRLKEAILDGELIAYKREIPNPRGTIDDLISGELPLSTDNKISKTDIEKVIKDIRQEASNINFSHISFLVGDVCQWTKDVGLNDNFFAKKLLEEEKKSETFSKKLRAANDAYNALISDPALLKGKSVKAAAIKWLKENAIYYDLTNASGKPIELAIEEIAKIVNWKQEGGAPST